MRKPRGWQSHCEIRLVLKCAYISGKHVRRSGLHHLGTLGTCLIRSSLRSFKPRLHLASGNQSSLVGFLNIRLRLWHRRYDKLGSSNARSALPRRVQRREAIVARENGQDVPLREEARCGAEKGIVSGLNSRGVPPVFHQGVHHSSPSQPSLWFEHLSSWPWPPLLWLELPLLMHLSMPSRHVRMLALLPVRVVHQRAKAPARVKAQARAKVVSRCCFTAISQVMC
jgi:hypothetical protein